MFAGGALCDRFDEEGMSLDIDFAHDFAHERLDLLAANTSSSLHFGPEIPCEFASSMTLTVLLEAPSPSVDAFVVAPLGLLTEPKPDTMLPAGKASLSVVDEATSTASLGGRGVAEMAPRVATGDGLATRLLPGTVGRFARTFRDVEGAPELVGRYWAGVGRILRGHIRTGVQDVRGALFEMRTALEFGPDSVVAFGREGDILLRTGALIEAKSGGSLFVGAGKMGQFGRYIQMRNSGDISDLIYFFGRDPDPRTVELLYRHGVDWYMI